MQESQPMSDFHYDDSRLMRLFGELDARQRRKALKGAMAASARALRRAAVSNLRASGLARSRFVERGIRTATYRRKLGFRVTVGTKRGRAAGSDPESRRKARLSVVPLWAEGGTKARATKGGRARGAMRPYRFMERTKAAEAPGIERTMKQSIVDYIEKTAKKYGCS